MNHNKNINSDRFLIKIIYQSLRNSEVNIEIFLNGGGG